MMVLTGLHTQAGDTPTARLHPNGEYVVVDLSEAPGGAPDNQLFITSPEYLAALLDVLSVTAAEWKVQRAGGAA